jgi:L-ribulose-5-phosphate 3-epimerase
MSDDPRDLPRRHVLRTTSLALGAVALGVAAGGARAAAPVAAAEATTPPRLRLVLAQWSLQRMLLAGDLDPLDFPRAARRQFGLDAVAYGGPFLKGQVRDTDAIADLARRAGDEGVTGVVLTCDGVGRLGDPDDKVRTQAVENHFPWVEAAKRLGCPAIRVDAASGGTPEEQEKLLADGIARLAEYAAQMKMAVLVANHGQPASNAAWLAGLIRAVGRPDVAALPDVGSFADYDRYLGMEQLAPVARGLAATAHEFDNDGEDVRTNYRRLLRIAVDGGYRGWLAVAYTGKALPEPEGVRTTKRLLERIRRELVA